MDTEEFMNILFGLLIWFIISASVGVILGIFIKKSEVSAREIYDGKYELDDLERTILDAKAIKMATESFINLRAKAEEEAVMGFIVTAA
jgi:hypothetical protein